MFVLTLITESRCKTVFLKTDTIEILREKENKRQTLQNLLDLPNTELVLGQC